MSSVALLAPLVATVAATVTIDGPALVVLAALMLASVAANVYLVVHVRRVERRLTRVLGEVDALRDVLNLRRQEDSAKDTPPTDEGAPDDAAP